MPCVSVSPVLGKVRGSLLVLQHLVIEEYHVCDEPNCDDPNCYDSNWRPFLQDIGRYKQLSPTLSLKSQIPPLLFVLFPFLCNNGVCLQCEALSSYQQV